MQYHVLRYVWLTIVLVLLSGCNDTTSHSKKQTSETVVRQVDGTLTPLDNWSIRLKAKNDNGILCGGAQLGTVENATDAKSRSLEAWSNPSARLEILFTPEGRSATSMLYIAQNAAKKIWPFEIRSSDDTATITLQWTLYRLSPRIDEEGRKRYEASYLPYHPKLRNMRLYDLDTGTVVAAEKNNTTASYTFSMNGTHIRRFEWRMEDTPVSADSALLSEVKTHTSVIRKEHTKPVSFDPNRPPFFEEGR
jgi:hypothetical protein